MCPLMSFEFFLVCQFDIIMDKTPEALFCAQVSNIKKKKNCDVYVCGVNCWWSVAICSILMKGDLLV